MDPTTFKRFTLDTYLSEVCFLRHALGRMIENHF
jgi:hypothetical protein